LTCIKSNLAKVANCHLLDLGQIKVSFVVFGDLLTLARNARTSVEMIERFYASQLTPEMNIALLQSRR
jgi:hypothetical protein